MNPQSLLRFSGGNHLPEIIQSEGSECGLACLAMISSYYGHDVDLNVLRRQFPISIRGTTAKQLLDIAGQMSLDGRAVKAPVEQIRELQLPCILHWQMNHFVVLHAIASSSVTIHDPARGRMQVPMKDFTRHFTGIAIELAPATSFQKGESKVRLRLSQFWHQAKGMARGVSEVIALSLLLQVLAILAPLYMQNVVDNALPRSDQSLVAVLAIGFGMLVLIQSGTSYLRQIVILRLSNSLSVQIQSNLFRHLLALPFDFFSKRHIGDITSRFGSTNAIRNVMTSSIVTAIVDGVMALLMLAVMFIYNVKLTILTIVVVLAFLAIKYVAYVYQQRLTRESLVARAEQSSYFMESIRTILTVKLLQLERSRFSHWQNLLVAMTNKEIQLSKVTINLMTITDVLFGILTIVIVYLAALDVIAGLMSIGMLFAYLSYAQRFSTSIQSFSDQYVTYRLVDVHLDRMSDIVFTDSEYPELTSSESNAAENFKHQSQIKLQVSGLSFRYSDFDPVVLENVDLNVDQGELVVIGGPSGCGKTTLLKCCLGLLVPTEGMVLVDGIDIHTLPEYRRSVGAVMQEDELLRGTLAENIAAFDGSINAESLTRATTLACVDDDIREMPLGYNTAIGELGSALSSGQKQRILIARAIYRNPSLIFLDEATNHLDVDTEVKVIQAIKSIGTTCIMVAHRPETAKLADRYIGLR